jgi:hypothetical protein
MVDYILGLDAVMMDNKDVINIEEAKDQNTYSHPLIKLRRSEPYVWGAWRQDLSSALLQRFVFFFSVMAAFDRPNFARTSLQCGILDGRIWLAFEVWRM